MSTWRRVWGTKQACSILLNSIAQIITSAMPYSLRPAVIVLILAVSDTSFFSFVC